MDNSLHFDYNTFHREHQPSSGDLEVVNYDDLRHGGPFLGVETHFDQPVMNYHSEGLSYTPTAAVEGVFNGVNSHNAAYWPGSEKFAQRPVILQVHAPVPIPGCASILRNDSCYSEETPAPDSASTHCYITTQYPTEFQPGRPQIQRHGYDSISSSTPCVTARSQVHSTFPTPSELLVELTSGANQYRHTPVSTRTQGLGRVTSTKHQRSNLSSRPIVEAKAITDSLLLASSLNDSSSETITSHEKKRHYLECLEHYVAFLHEHFRRNGLEPAALERISNYRCLNSRSIRSLLIHMEKTTGQMQERIVREEQKFLRLREALQRKESAPEMAQGSERTL